MKRSLMALVVLSLSAPAYAATDPCAVTFGKIADALESANAEAALAFFTGSDRGKQAIRDASAAPEAAVRLAAVFRSAKLKTTFDSTALYNADWEASLGHTYSIDIAATVGLLGCTVQAW